MYYLNELIKKLDTIIASSEYNLTEEDKLTLLEIRSRLTNANDDSQAMAAAFELMRVITFLKQFFDQ